MAMLRWTPVTLEALKQFLGLMLLTGLIQKRIKVHNGRVSTEKRLIGLYLVVNIEILLSEANRSIHARLAFPESLLQKHTIIGLL